MHGVFNQLLGQRLVSAERIHDYLQLRFENGAILNVFNKFVIAGGTSDFVSILDGCVLTAVEEAASAIELCFSDNTRLRVGLTDADFVGPEAMEHFDPNGLRVIWP